MKIHNSIVNFGTIMLMRRTFVKAEVGSRSSSVAANITETLPRNTPLSPTVLSAVGDLRVIFDRTSTLAPMKQNNSQTLHLLLKSDKTRICHLRVNKNLIFFVPDHKQINKIDYPRLSRDL